MSREDLLTEFRETVCEKSAEIDPSDEQDWYSLSLGWCLAKGMTIEEATAFAVEVRYTHHYWT